MKLELNSDWPKTKAALEAYEKAVEEFRAEIIDGEPTLDAFFMALFISSAAEKMARALGKEYEAKHPLLRGIWGEIKACVTERWKR